MSPHDNFIVTLVAVLWLGSATTAAQQADAEPGRAAVDEQAMLFESIPSVFGASKFEQTVNEAPSTISIVTADEIQKYGYRTLAAILASLRGFYLSYDRNYHYVGVRGFLRPGDYNSRILMLIDGIRINDNIYDSAWLGTDSPIDIDLIDRVEVIRGPSSSLYGANAFFAVVNVITKRGRDYKGVQPVVKAGSFESYQGAVNYGQKYKSGVELLVSASIYSSDGDDALYYQEFDDPETNNGVAEDSDSDEFRHFFARVGYEDWEFELAHSNREKQIPTAPWGVVFNDPRTATRDSYNFVNAAYDHDFSARSSIQAQLSYHRYDYDGDYAYDYAEDPSDPPYIVVNKDEELGTWWNADAQYTQDIGEAHTLIAGAEYRLSVDQFQTNYDEDVYLDINNSLDNWGVYLQDEFRIASSLRLSMGLRYDHFDSFGGTTNPRFALLYSPTPGGTLKVMYGKAFRAPSAYELFYHDGGESTKAPLELDPETIVSYELAWEQYFDSGLAIIVDVYYYVIDDLISLKTDPVDDLLVFDNLDKVTAHGAELELEGRLFGEFDGRVSYTYQNAEDERTGEQLTNSPENMARFNLNGPVFKDLLFVGLELQYNDERITVGGGTTGSSFLTNFTLYSTQWVKGIELSASVYNLFDEDYGHPGSEEHEQDVIYQDGRTFRVRAAYVF